MDYRIGKTEKCIVGKCDKPAKYWDEKGFVLKSRDKVQAGFCEHHWFITNCPNSFNMKGCFGLYNKNIGIKNN